MIGNKILLYNVRFDTLFEDFLLVNLVIFLLLDFNEPYY